MLCNFQLSDAIYLCLEQYKLVDILIHIWCHRHQTKQKWPLLYISQEAISHKSGCTSFTKIFICSCLFHTSHNTCVLSPAIQKQLHCLLIMPSQHLSLVINLCKVIGLLGSVGWTGKQQMFNLIQQEIISLTLYLSGFAVD